MKFGNVNIRPFTENDILNKVRWINDCENNKFLHYELPLDEDKTRAWFHKNKDRADRYDAIIEYDSSLFPPHFPRCTVVGGRASTIVLR